MLATDPRIDSARIGFWGLSQGGWIALLAAQHSPNAAFAISVSAPLTQSVPQMLFAIASSLRIKGYPQAEVDMAVRTRATIAAYYRGETDRAAAQKVLDAALPRPWLNLAYLPRALIDPKTSRWPKEMANDPLATIGAVKILALLLFGARDPWIPVQTSVDRLKTLESKRHNVEWAKIADADHTMSVSSPPWQQIDPAYMSDDVPEAPDYFSRAAGLAGANWHDATKAPLGREALLVRALCIGGSLVGKHSLTLSSSTPRPGFAGGGKTQRHFIDVRKRKGRPLSSVTLEMPAPLFSRRSCVAADLPPQ